MTEIKLDSLGRFISPEAEFGRDVEIGAHTQIYGKVIIEEKFVIGSHCIIGNAKDGLNNGIVKLGKNSHIRKS